MTTAPVKKACDSCHKRKVRCTGGQPCKNCDQASLQCTYLAIPQKKGPKGSRAKVISEIRESQQRSSQSPTTAKSHHDLEQNPFDFNAPLVSPDRVRNVELLNEQIVDSCLQFYLQHMYPTLPIFHRQRLAELAGNLRKSTTEVYCLIAAVCAFIMIQPGMTLPGLSTGSDGSDPDTKRTQHATELLEEIRRVRKGVDFIESPSLCSVQTSFFLFASYFCLEKSNACWFHIREATTLAQLLLMHEESTYHGGDVIDNIFRRRTYWLLLLTERAYAMERHRPLTLYGTIELPTEEEDPEESHLISGFLALVNLYRLIDDDFMAIWNKAKSECSTAWLSQLQQQLVDVLPPDLKCTENQAADVRITQHWLRTMVWQLSITNGYLSSSSTDVAMTFKYPIYIAKDLMNDVLRLSQQSMEVHGVGLIEKLFDVACTLTDVITCVPIENDPELPPDAPSEYLNQLLDLISRLRGGASKFQLLLVAKVSENLPALTSPTSDMSPIALNSFAPNQSSDAVMSLPALAPAPSSKHAPPPPLPQSPFGGAAASPFNEHARGLMFDGHSPSHSHVSEKAMTPMTPPVGTPHQGILGTPAPGLPPLTVGSGVPRSVPMVVFTNDPSTTYEGCNG